MNENVTNAPDCPDCESDRTLLWGGTRADILCYECQQFKHFQIDREECWRCGYLRPTFESCPECGGSCKPLTREKQRGDA